MDAQVSIDRETYNKACFCIATHVRWALSGSVLPAAAGHSSFRLRRENGSHALAGRPASRCRSHSACHLHHSLGHIFCKSQLRCARCFLGRVVFEDFGSLTCQPTRRRCARCCKSQRQRQRLAFAILASTNRPVSVNGLRTRHP